MSAKIELPKYAWLYDHPANQRGDISATFLTDELHNQTITVSIQSDEEQFFHSVERGGILEGRFTRLELERVLEISTILLQAIK